jgi:putative flippase GtrA
MKKSNLKDLFLYLIVGGIATVTEWILFYLLDKCAVHYTVATIIAYVISTFFYFCLIQILTFLNVFFILEIAHTGALFESKH